MLTKKCHFIGIGGIGMSGLARILLKKKIEVTGSDISASYVTDNLSRAGAKIFLGHDSNHINPNMTVIFSSDIKKDNPEYQAAISLKCQMLHRSDLLQMLMSDYKTLAVSGTHGKTTTSSLLAWVLSEAKLEPSYAVGGMIPQFNSNADHGKGHYFVAEADESDGTFLKYNPFGAIITNIDFDHMNYFGNESGLKQAFKTFASKVSSPNHLFYCGDDSRLKALAIKGISYGFGQHCLLRASKFVQNGWGISFDIDFQGKHYKKIDVSLAGLHNAYNAMAVFGLALNLGVSEDAIRAAFKSFKGVLRRCEKKGDLHGILFLDDYAHHPTEVKSTLKGIREAIQERRLVAIFQPHRYSRTKDCLGTFGHVFEEADEVIITDIYGAGEPPIPGISSESIINEITNASKVCCRYVSREGLSTYLCDSLRVHDVVVTLGAGDITKLSGEILEKFKKEAPQKLKVGVVYGGRSVEHEISLMSAKHVSQSLNPDLYQIQHFCISKNGKWGFKNKDAEVQEDKCEKLISSQVMEELLKCDLFFPVLHGTYGEDGTIQGFFEMLDKAYVGCDYRSAAICMDKALTKRLMQINGIATSPFISISKYEWNRDPFIIKQQILEKLSFPVFVKPVHLGSSIGVSKVECIEELDQAIEHALYFDHQILVENGIVGREIEFAVLGNDRVTVFPPGEICTGGKIYDYDGKYGPKGMSTDAQAKLPSDQIDEGMHLAEKAYRAANCTGMARVDCFLDNQGKFWLNEINPIPGFTKISLYPKICEANGLEAKELMDRLIILALHRKR